MFKNIVKTSLLASILSLSSVGFAHDGAHNDQLEDTMDEMKDNFKKLRKADDTAEMKPYVEQLQILADKATELKPERIGDDAPTAEDLETYDSQMQKFKDQLTELLAAIDKGDQEQAESLVKALGKTRKESHEYFDIK